MLEIVTMRETANNWKIVYPENGPGEREGKLLRTNNSQERIRTN